jgi:hypothetical protein
MEKYYTEIKKEDMKKALNSWIKTLPDKIGKVKMRIFGKTAINFIIIIHEPDKKHVPECTPVEDIIADFITKNIQLKRKRKTAHEIKHDTIYKIMNDQTIVKDLTDDEEDRLRRTLVAAKRPSKALAKRVISKLKARRKETTTIMKQIDDLEDKIDVRTKKLKKIEKIVKISGSWCDIPKGDIKTLEESMERKHAPAKGRISNKAKITSKVTAISKKSKSKKLLSTRQKKILIDKIVSKVNTKKINRNEKALLKEMLLACDDKKITQKKAKELIPLVITKYKRRQAGKKAWRKRRTKK